MTNKDFFNAYRGEPVLYKGNDIGAYVAGYVEEKYIILGFYDDKGCILAFNTDVNIDKIYLLAELKNRLKISIFLWRKKLCISLIFSNFVVSNYKVIYFTLCTTCMQIS